MFDDDKTELTPRRALRSKKRAWAWPEGEVPSVRSTMRNFGSTIGLTSAAVSSEAAGSDTAITGKRIPVAPNTGRPAVQARVNAANVKAISKSKKASSRKLASKRNALIRLQKQPYKLRDIPNRFEQKPIASCYLDKSYKTHRHSCKGGKTCDDKHCGAPLHGKKGEVKLELRDVDKTGVKAKVLAMWDRRVLLSEKQPRKWGWGEGKYLQLVEGDESDCFKRKNSRTQVRAPAPKRRICEDESPLIIPLTGGANSIVISYVSDEEISIIDMSEVDDIVPGALENGPMVSSAEVASIPKISTGRGSFRRSPKIKARKHIEVTRKFQERVRGKSIVSDREVEPSIGETIEQATRLLEMVNKLSFAECKQNQLFMEETPKMIMRLRGRQPTIGDHWKGEEIDEAIIGLLHPGMRETFKPISTTGDGSCFYNALSILYFGNEKGMPIFRLISAYGLVCLQSFFPELLRRSGSASTMDSIMKTITTPNAWADSNAILCASFALNRPINVYRDSFRKRNNSFSTAATYPELVYEIHENSNLEYSKHQSYQVCFDSGNPAPLNIFHVNNNHFVALAAVRNCEPILLTNTYQRIIDLTIHRMEEMVFMQTSRGHRDGSNHCEKERVEVESRQLDKRSSATQDLDVIFEETVSHPPEPDNQYQNLDEHQLRNQDKIISSVSQQCKGSAIRMKRLRDSKEYREQEKRKDKERKRLMRNNKAFRDKEKRSDNIRKAETKDRASFSDAEKSFMAMIKNGPTESCFICRNLWFPSSLRKIDVTFLIEHNMSDEVISAAHEKEVVCNTCYMSVLKSKLPVYSVFKGIKFPEIPDVLRNMTPLKEIMVSARLPFMTIRTLGRDRQFGLKGAVVNVPINVDTSVQILPRTYDETQTIQIALMRKMSYKHPYKFEAVRPKVVYDAAKYLVQMPLYKKQNIALSDSWSQDIKSALCSIEEANPESEISPLEIDDDEEPVNPGGQETLLHSGLINDAVGIKFAPGEGQRPMGLLLDDDAEALSFPSLYGGQEDLCKFMKPGQMAKFKARHEDRRCAKIPVLFFTYKKLEMQRLAGAIGICVRKSKKFDINMKAKDLLDENFLKDLFMKDDGYKFLKGIRSSPAYWEEKKKSVFAMIRQLGVPSLFITFSAAETRWPELLVILQKVLYNKIITEAEAMNLSFEEKAEMIRKDPVTCARYFEYKFRTFFHKIMLNKDGPFKDNEIVDFYIRFEFQHRGSVHAHMIVWLRNAPKYIKHNLLSMIACESFIDNIISTNSADAEDEMIKLQTHKHTFTCRESADKRCRFGMPMPPMEATKILEPINIDEDVDVKTAKANFKRIIAYINTTEAKNSDDFQSFIRGLNISKEDYILAIRSSIRRTKVFLKRSPIDCRVNAFNPTMIRLFRSNMDIQFIVDAYACVSYVIDYINKSNRGMSLLMREVVNELKHGNMSIKDKLKHVANKFMNASEISAQEAAYYVLELAVSKSSRSSIYINTSRPETRVSLVKPMEILMALDPESTDVYCGGLISHYVLRPDTLEEITLAAFAANFEYSKSKRIRRSNTTDREFDDDDDDTFFEDEPRIEPRYIPLRDNSGFVRRRTKPKIIMFRRFQKELDEVEFCREQLMLFYRWRNESEELLNTDIIKRYNIHKLEIESERVMFTCSDHRRLEDVESELINARQEDASSEPKESVEHEFDAYAPNETVVGDLAEAAGLYVKTKDLANSIQIPRLISEDMYDEVVRTLNVKQRQYFYHMMSALKTGNTIHEFVNGGAGVGKSRLITALYQSLLRYYQAKPGHSASSIPVLLCAPTGRAAFNISGQTLHSAFKLPVTQNREGMSNLSADFANSLAARFADLKLVIIDEISMVGATMFSRVEQRMRQIMNSNLIFGGLSVIAFGDFNQLKPVGDSYIFQSDRKDPYGIISKNVLWQNFRFFELTEIMRQREDAVFAKALNRLAHGALTTADIELFKSRQRSGYSKDAIHLFPTNAEVDSVNTRILNAMTTEGYIHDATDICNGNIPNATKNSYLKSLLKYETSETYGLPASLQIRVDAKYMITVNLNTEDGLVNGSIGTLRHITKSAGNKPKPMILWLQFEDENIGRSARADNGHLIKKYGIKSGLTPIIEETKLLANKGHQKQVQLFRKQFPLVPAASVTINKIQGASEKEVVVHTDNIRQMDRKKLYVAMSRATTAAGLYISGPFNAPAPPQPDDKCSVELARMKENPVLFESVRLIDSPHIVFHNIQSYRKNSKFLENDVMYREGKAIFLVETWTSTRDKPEIAGFNLVQNISGSGHKPKGILVFSKPGVLQYRLPDMKLYETTFSIEITGVKILEVCFIVVYATPKTPFRKLIDILKAYIQRLTGAIFVVGDFNKDIKLLPNLATMNKFLLDMKMKWSIGCPLSSTNGDTQIDFCFSNCDNWFGSYYESVTSYHKPIIIFDRQIESCKASALRSHRPSAIHRSTQPSSKKSMYSKLEISKKLKGRGMRSSEKKRTCRSRIFRREQINSSRKRPRCRTIPVRRKLGNSLMLIRLKYRRRWKRHRQKLA